MTETLMTIGDVAAAARLSERTVKRAIASGELLALRIGRSTRVRPADYTEWIESKRRPTTPPNALECPRNRPRRPARTSTGPVQIPKR